MPARDRCYLFTIYYLSRGALHKRRVELDLNSRERLRHRTILFRRLSGGEKRLLINARHFALGSQFDRSDLESFTNLFETDIRVRADAFRIMTGFCKPRGQRHRKTSGMRRANQLFRISASSFLKA